MRLCYSFKHKIPLNENKNGLIVESQEYFKFEIGGLGRVVRKPINTNPEQVIFRHGIQFFGG